MNLAEVNRHLVLAALFAAALFAMPRAAAAGDLADYTSRLTDARAIVREMIVELVNHSGQTSISGFDADKVNMLRALLPAKETVETPDGPVLASNAWLHSSIDEYITRETPEGRAEI